MIQFDHNDLRLGAIKSGVCRDSKSKFEDLLREIASASPVKATEKENIVRRKVIELISKKAKVVQEEFSTKYPFSFGSKKWKASSQSFNPSGISSTNPRKYCEFVEKQSQDPNPTSTSDSVPESNLKDLSRKIVSDSPLRESEDVHHGFGLPSEISSSSYESPIDIFQSCKLTDEEEEMVRWALLFDCPTGDDWGDIVYNDGYLFLYKYDIQTLSFGKDVSNMEVDMFGAYLNRSEYTISKNEKKPMKKFCISSNICFMVSLELKNNSREKTEEEILDE
ncbi:uncharacterized protein LOC127243507 [Andrographis paniculata]|uniref:uncharacterized protein LOC127243507 n=1 Tax=Andrographis paniculata TaxID=175694 RepID=UPI0021E6F1A1|nr:uncharacterized protein LOC127243507 [Andrographis paniculata]